MEKKNKVMCEGTGKMDYGTENDIMESLAAKVEVRQRAIAVQRDAELGIIELLFNAPQGIQHRYMRVDWSKMKRDFERGWM